MRKKQKVEICAPAGSRESLAAALNAGADSVYFGVGKLNMRAWAAGANFSLRSIASVADKCRSAGAKAYLALNSIVYDGELKDVVKICAEAAKAGVSAVIASDFAVIERAAEAGLPVHISVQSNVSNTGALRFYSRYADAVIPARELDLRAVARMAKTIRDENIRGPSGDPVKIELFAHGALCVGVSGLCGMGLCLHSRSANRGLCVQPCRREYKITDTETGDELVVSNRYVLSPKDICVLPFLDKIIKAGVSILKIEGRGRPADYVSAVTSVYREAAESAASGRFDRARLPEWTRRLGAVFNRGFWEGGYYLGKKLEAWGAADGNAASERKKYIGRVLNYYPKARAALVQLETDGLAEGEEILITGPTTGALRMTVPSLRVDGAAVRAAARGAAATIPAPEKARKNDRVFAIKSNSQKLPGEKI
jgi:putative protease